MPTAISSSLIDSFRAIASVSADLARSFLQRADGDVSRALNLYYESDASPADTIPPAAAHDGLRRSGGARSLTAAAFRSSVEQTFASLAGAPGATALTDEHMETIARHIGIDPFTDPLMLYILYTMEVKEPGEVPKENFVKGFTSMGVPTLDALRSKVPTLRDEMNSDAVFPKFYVWCYGYSCEPGQRTLSRETATALAPILISTERWPAIGDWVAFLESQTKTVSKDTWAQVLTFARTTKPDLSDYDDGGAWPSMIDDFVEYMRAKAKA